MRFPTLSSRDKSLLAGLFTLLILIFLSLAAWKCLAEAGMGYNWQWHRVWRYFGHYGSNGFTAGPLLEGIWVTVFITCIGMIASLAAGLLCAGMRLSPWGVCVLVSRLYVAIWRTTPLLLQLFVAYFLLAPLINLSPIFTAILALGMFEGAYFAEIFRSGILSIHKNQWEAGLSLGLNLGQTFRIVILPQAVRNVLPALSNQAIALLKDSSLVSAIAVADLTMRSQEIIAETFLAFEVWLIVGAIYLFMALFIALPALWLERYIPLNKE